MRRFRVMRHVATGSKDKPYSVVDQEGNPLTRRNGYAIRTWGSEKAAQKIADLCNDAEQYPHS